MSVRPQRVDDHVEVDRDSDADDEAEGEEPDGVKAERFKLPREEEFTRKVRDSHAAQAGRRGPALY